MRIIYTNKVLTEKYKGCGGTKSRKAFELLKVAGEIPDKSEISFVLSHNNENVDMSRKHR